MVIMDISLLYLEKLRNKLYADSPYNLASYEDDAYRQGVDFTLYEVEKTMKEGE